MGFFGVGGAPKGGDRRNIADHILDAATRRSAKDLPPWETPLPTDDEIREIEREYPGMFTGSDDFGSGCTEKPPVKH